MKLLHHTIVKTESKEIFNLVIDTPDGQYNVNHKRKN